MNTDQKKAKVFLDLYQIELQLGKKLVKARREYDIAVEDLAVARKNLGAIVGSNVPDRLFKLEGGDYVDVHFDSLGKYTIRVRHSEPTE